jgi:hypothetical protein
MNTYLRHSVTAAIALASGLMSLVLFAPSAFAAALVLPDGRGPRSYSGAVSHSTRVTGNPVASGGIASWEVVLITLAATLAAAGIAALAYRAYQSQPQRTMAAS